MSSYDPFDETRRQMEQVKRWARQRRGVVLGGGLGLIFVAALVTSYYQVEAEETGIVLRFGKVVDRTDPGLHFKLPFGIDQNINVPTSRQMRLEFGFRTARADIQSEFIRNARTMAESRMLTADLNLGTVEWIVQYIIDDAEKFLFEFRNVETTLRLMSEATMRSVVGDYTVDELITGGRAEIEAEAQKRMIKLNDEYGTGVRIQYVKLKRVDVPDPVKPALSEVEEAKQEKERLINQADEEYNKVIPRARGRADQTIAAARGYETKRVNEAKGDAARFKALYSEYRKAQDITRTRLYFEALGRALPKAQRKILVDEDAKGLVPLLNLDGGRTP